MRDETTEIFPDQRSLPDIRARPRVHVRAAAAVRVAQVTRGRDGAHKWRQVRFIAVAVVLVVAARALLRKDAAAACLGRVRSNRFDTALALVGSGMGTMGTAGTAGACTRAVRVVVF